MEQKWTSFRSDINQMVGSVVFSTLQTVFLISFGDAADRIMKWMIRIFFLRAGLPTYWREQHSVTWLFNAIVSIFMHPIICQPLTFISYGLASSVSWLVFIYETHIQQPNISLTFASIALHVFASFGKQHNGWSWLWALIELKSKVDCYSFYTVFSGLTIYKL